MAVLYLTEPGSVIRKRGERLVVEKDKQELLEVELRRLNTVIMLESVHVTTPALVLMLSFGVEFALITADGYLLGQLTPPLARNIAIRKAQFRKETDQAWALDQARQIVAAKIHNSREVLIRHMWDRGAAGGRLKGPIDALERREQQARDAVTLPELVGHEGAAAARYWGCFGTLLRNQELGFQGRNKRPPPDPVNATLSYGYTLLTNAFRSLLDGLGFDPFLGFLHQEAYGRPSLALDLVEPFRAPVVDRLALRLFNLGVLQSSDFTAEPGKGRRFSRPGLRKFFTHWDENLTKMEITVAMRKQAEHMARVFLDREPLLKPWLWKAKP